MHTPINHLANLNEVRKTLFNTIKTLSPDQVNYKQKEDHWSILEILEHLVWTEYWNNFRLWKMLRLTKNQEEPVNRSEVNFTEAMAKQKSPDGIINESCTKPRWGGSAEYWLNMLVGCGKLSQEVVDLDIGLQNEVPKRDYPMSNQSIHGFEQIDQYFRDQQSKIESILKDGSFPR